MARKGNTGATTDFDGTAMNRTAENNINSKNTLEGVGTHNVGGEAHDRTTRGNLG